MTAETAQLRRRTRALAAALWPLLLGALPVPGAASDAHRYLVRVTPALDRLAVEARFPAPVDRLEARSRRADDLLLDARDCRGGSLHIAGRRLQLAPDGSRCVRYTVALDRGARTERRNRTLADDNVMLSPTAWLWLPVGDDKPARVRFSLPDGVQVSVPWARAADDPSFYEIPPSPRSAQAPAVFGRFSRHEIDAAGGARLRVSLLAADPPLDEHTILTWLEAAAADVALAYGRFPNPSPQIVVVPIGHPARRGGGAVPFGRVIRDGGESIEFFVDQRRPLAEFLADWTATHEFSHLMLPYIGRSQRWLSEGFAQYYQNVLRARSGAYAPLEAWQNLYEGFERGRRSRPDLSPNAAAGRDWRGARMKVYWSGAALALLADVSLREQSDGRVTLDTVLDRLQDCCLPSSTTWTGPDLMARLDELAGRDVFVPLYERYADRPGFPPAVPALERLGLDIVDGRVRYRDGGELVAIRDAITGLDAETAAWRDRLDAD